MEWHDVPGGPWLFNRLLYSNEQAFVDSCTVSEAVEIIHQRDPSDFSFAKANATGFSPDGPTTIYSMAFETGAAQWVSASNYRSADAPNHLPSKTATFSAGCKSLALWTVAQAKSSSMPARSEAACR
jgi:hypothetical protein